MKLRVADFYCGAGGFSEGFRQMGFKIIYGMDNWAPAVETFRKNFPTADVPSPTDILNINLHELPDVDVVIGGPPCTYFSLSNRGGNGDIAKGIKLVNRFLMIIEELDPKWWVMENIPRLVESLPEKITYETLGNGKKPGNFQISLREVLNAADYGVPQTRSRLFSGKFIIPMPTHSKNGGWGTEKWRNMRQIVEAFPHPLVDDKSTKINDPLYPGLSLNYIDFTDHSYDTFLTSSEVLDADRTKTRHRYYGKMNFPDDLNRPSRTVVASIAKTCREMTIIKESRANKKGHRIPTVRENASLQSFPISFQFFGTNIRQRYKLVGNAVPPILSRSIAAKILEAEKLSFPDKPIVNTKIDELPIVLSSSSICYNKKWKNPLNRPFSDFIGNKATHSRFGCRIDIDNKGEPHMHPIYGRINRKKIKHIVGWRCVLYTGYAGTVEKIPISLKSALSLVNKNNPEKFNQTIKKLLKEVIKKKIYEIPDATTCQGIFLKRVHGLHENPYWIRKMLIELAEKYFPEKSMNSLKILDDFGQIPIKEEIKLSQKNAAYLIATAITCEIMNTSDFWLKKNYNKHLKLDEWPNVNQLSTTNGFDSIGKIEKFINS